MIDGRSFLAVAEALATYEGEDFVRTRIGRLYYGTWLEARSFCEMHFGYQREKMAREHRVIAALLGELDATLDYDLRLLRDARNQADYDLQLSVEYCDELLRSALRSSARAMARLDTLKKDHGA